MKRLVAALGLFSVSTILFSLDCGYLGITIMNASGHDCKLRNTTLRYGALYQGGVQAEIPNGTTSKTFYLEQGYKQGAGVTLDYRCDNKVVIFYSLQTRCGLFAGSISGWPYIGNDLALEHWEIIGSSWSPLPGQITWKIN